MTVDPHSARSIFLAAVENHPPAHWAEFLNHECGEDSELRRRVEILLRAHQEADSLLDGSDAASQATIAYQSTSNVGIQIGPYKLLQPIGEGGMGTVYLAEQTQPVQRKVALKVIKAGMDSRQVIARFEAERQALALMDHPHIAKVLDAGATPDGRPYFVMELVKGVPITRYCDEHHLPPRDRLELFVTICQAVQHAHQKGIIHRDLKPSNVLIAQYDGKPVAKVIDFGVAKATGSKLTEQTLHTEFGSIVGTLEYMSPEQAEFNQLDIDTRSDVYSLGVLLYELLTGTTPFERKRLKEAALLEVLRVIKEVEPQKPSTRLSTTDELPSIAANRSLEPKKLSGLVRGDLDWIVMKALEKDRARRYETANGFALDVQRYLTDEPVLASPPSARYKLRKFMKRNRARVAITGVLILSFVIMIGGIVYTLSDRAARRARLNSHIELILDEVARLERELNWPEALAAAKWADSAKVGGEVDATLQDRVRQALSDLELVRRLEGIRLRKGSTDVNDAQVDRLYKQVFLDVGVDLLASDMSLAVNELKARSAITSALGSALDDWASTRTYLSDSGETEALRGFANAIDPDPWRRPLREAWAHNEWEIWERLAASPDLTRQPPATLLMLGVTLCKIGKQDRGIDVLRTAARRYPGDFWINFELGHFLHTAGPAHFDESLAYSRAALAIRPRFSEAWNNVGSLLVAKGRLDDATECLRQAIELQRSDPVAHDALGVVYHNKGEWDQAIVQHRKAIALDPEFANAHFNLGAALESKKDWEGAIAEYRRALTIEPRWAMPHCGLGNCLKARGDLDDAIASYRQAIVLKPDLAIAHLILGNALQQRKQFDEARACYRRAIEHDPRDYRPYMQLGFCQQELGRMDEAVSMCRKALELNPCSETYKVLGRMLMWNHQIVESLACCRRAVELAPQDSGAHNALGNILAWTQKRDDAIASYRTALDCNPEPDLEAAVYGNMAMAYLWNDQVKESIEAHRRVIELQPTNAERFSNFARLMVSCDAKHRDPVEAMRLAERAVKLSPENGEYWNTYGVAQYRGEKFQSCIDALNRSIALRQGGDCVDMYFLAMSYWQLGDKQEALRWHNRALEWLGKNSIKTWYKVEELNLFRREASTMLGFQNGVPFPGHTEQVRVAIYSPDGRLALTAGVDKSLRLWDVPTRTEKAIWNGHTDSIFSAAFSANGRTAVSGSWDGTMRWWDVASGKELHRFDHPRRVWAVAFDPTDQRALSAGSDNVIRLWDLESGKESIKFEGHTDHIRSAVFSSDGKHILSGSQDKTIRLWDAKSGQEVRRFTGHTSLVLSVSLSPDGRQAVSGGSDAVVRLWNVDTGESLGEFNGHEGNIEATTFTADGRRILTAGVDGKIRLWNLPDGREIHRIETEETLGLSVSPDGRKLLSANKDNCARQWTLPVPTKDLPESKGAEVK